MTKRRWVNIYKPSGNMSLTETIPGLQFVEWEIPSVSTSNDDLEISGRDGVIPGAINFAPFSLVLNFYYEGNDMEDLNLFSQTMKSIVHNREPYYIAHSDMPDYKYAVNKAEIEWEVINHGDSTFKVTFNCYKGYAESLYSTDDYNLMSSNFWQYENGLISDTDIKYIHTTNNFKIYNASSDKINPLLDHNLDIYMTVVAPNGFKMKNKTNKTEFNYLGKMKKEGTILINKTYPYINKKRIGKDTDKGYLILDKGINDISITGDGLEIKKIKFDFNFIYR